MLKLRVNNEPVEAMSRIVRAHKAHDLPRDGGDDEGDDEPPGLRDRDPGRRRLEGRRARDAQGDAEERLAKCYGGDVWKKKLLQKQKEARSAASSTSTS